MHDEATSSKGWLALVALATAQFLMVLDQSVMNVSISALVKDFHTTVTTIQAVITLYCLVMAMLILTGAKIGDMIGRRRAFVIGLIIYACGSALTAASQSVAVLALGWSLLEGIGAALVLPALAALIAGNFEGSRRKVAYAIIGGVAGAGIAVGPILGGWATTEVTWRIVFVGEVIIVAFILVMTPKVGDAPRPDPNSETRCGRLGPLCFRSRALRLWGLAVEHMGLAQAQELSDHDLRFLAHDLRHHSRWGSDLGIRGLAAPPREQESRPTRSPLPGTDPSGAIGVDRALQPESDPDGHLLRGAALPPDGPRSQRP